MHSFQDMGSTLSTLAYVSTRIPAFPLQIFKRMHQHNVRIVDVASSRTLFRMRAGLKGTGALGLQCIEDEILAACNGLPLALKLMGGLLYKRRDLGFWKVGKARPKSKRCGSVMQRGLFFFLCSHGIVCAN